MRGLLLPRLDLIKDRQQGQEAIHRILVDRRGSRGFGLCDRRVVDIVKSIDDPYPYFRGMIAEIGLRARNGLL